MYQRIVVPLDGSDVAERALGQAVELAEALKVPLHLVRVVDVGRLTQYGAYGMAASYAALEPILAEEQTAARDYLKRVEGDLGRRGLAVTGELRHGTAAHELAAAAHPGDVIVMASHGRTGISRWFLGSVAEEVMRTAPVPVLLVRAFAEQGPGGPGGHEAAPPTLAPGTPAG